MLSSICEYLFKTRYKLSIQEIEYLDKYEIKYVVKEGEYFLKDGKLIRYVRIISGVLFMTIYDYVSKKEYFTFRCNYQLPSRCGEDVLRIIDTYGLHINELLSIAERGTLHINTNKFSIVIMDEKIIRIDNKYEVEFSNIKFCILRYGNKYYYCDSDYKYVPAKFIRNSFLTTIYCEDIGRECFVRINFDGSIIYMYNLDIDINSDFEFENVSKDTTYYQFAYDKYYVIYDIDLHKSYYINNKYSFYCLYNESCIVQDDTNMLYIHDSKKPISLFRSKYNVVKNYNKLYHNIITTNKCIAYYDDYSCMLYYYDVDSGITYELETFFETSIWKYDIYRVDKNLYFVLKPQVHELRKDGITLMKDLNFLKYDKI